MKRSILIYFLLFATFFCKANYVDSVIMKCYKLRYLGIYSDFGKRYQWYIVQFAFKNYSNKDKIFITSQGSLKNFFKSDNYFFRCRDTGQPNEENLVKAKSKFTMYRIIVIPYDKILQGKKDVEFAFVWITDKEYNSSKYDELVTIRKKKLYDKLCKETKDKKPASWTHIEREIDKHYKFDLIIGEKKYSYRDILSCKIIL